MTQPYDCARVARAQCSFPRVFCAWVRKLRVAGRHAL